MDFTREPIIETVITPREGCKLVVRSSKSSGQEEYFVDALEVVSFGSSFFFRSLERPKSFMVPSTDYEVLEVREPRMALKNVGQERKIKIAGGREGGKVREPQPQVQAQPQAAKEVKEDPNDPRGDKKRDRRRGRRRGRGGRGDEDDGQSQESGEAGDLSTSDVREATIERVQTTTSIVSALLPPPPTLISEQIQKYKQDDMYKDAFFAEREPPKKEQVPEELPVPAVEEEKSE